MLSTLFCVTASFAGAVALRPEPVFAPEAVFAIRAKEVYVGDGNTIENGTVLIEDGVIRAVGSEVDLPKGVKLLEHDGALTAGMIALHDYSGAAGYNHDSTRSVLSEAQVADAYRSHHSDYRRALESGITCVLLVPSPRNLCGGVTAVLRTAGDRELDRRGHLALSLCAASLGSNRFPTSTGGAMAEVERCFDEAEGAFAEVTAGKLPVLIEVRTRADVLRALDLCARRKLRGALSGSVRVGDLAEEIKQSGLGVVLNPFDVGVDSRAMRSAISLNEAGAPFAFGLDAPLRHPESLRFGAAMCVREGLEPQAAWSALTADAAQIAGVGDRVGRVALDMDADLVLWSGDPMDLSSSVVAVYVKGDRVHGGTK